MTPEIMVDVETLGTRPGSVIVTLGAVAFDRDAAEPGPELYLQSDPASAQRLGLTIDAQTVLWWLGQPDVARGALTGGKPLGLIDGLSTFSTWWSVVGGVRFWSHGANFDELMLSEAYRAAGKTPPWAYNNSRCTRTLYELAGLKPERDPQTHHNALDDARAQARAAILAFSVLKPKSEAA